MFKVSIYLFLMIFFFMGLFGLTNQFIEQYGFSVIGFIIYWVSLLNVLNLYGKKVLLSPFYK